tara:strand:+ start:74 stop:982 length:909 start_codon:yes stop_codon:yes gene_type:complete
MKNKRNLIYIAGPTGIGKTEISIKIAEILKTEIVSCDSRQLFKELKIGTSPPSKDQLSRIKHHFIHSRSIHEIYNVGMYEKDAINIINKLFKNYNNLILVGGSGLYADSILNGLDEFPSVPNKIRNNIKEKYAKEGIEYLQNKIKMLDPIYYKNVDINNSNRLIRALELIELTGKKYSSMISGKRKTRDFNMNVILLECSREKLYSQINNRVDRMINNGLENEVFSLKKFKHLNSLNTVGYKEFFNYFENKISYEETVNKIKQNTRNYAKRQITWFKKYSESQKINIENKKNIDFNKLILKQ